MHFNRAPGNIQMHLNHGSCAYVWMFSNWLWPAEYIIVVSWFGRKNMWLASHEEWQSITSQTHPEINVKRRDYPQWKMSNFPILPSFRELGISAVDTLWSRWAILSLRRGVFETFAWNTKSSRSEQFSLFSLTFYDKVVRTQRRILLVRIVISLVRAAAIIYRL